METYLIVALAAGVAVGFWLGCFNDQEAATKGVLLTLTAPAIGVISILVTLIQDPPLVCEARVLRQTCREMTFDEMLLGLLPPLLFAGVAAVVRGFVSAWSKRTHERPD